MYCSNCGAEVSAEAKYCNKCGQQLVFTVVPAEETEITTTQTTVEDPLITKVKLVHALHISLPIYKQIDEFVQRENRLLHNKLPFFAYILIGFYCFIVGFQIAGYIAAIMKRPSVLLLVIIAICTVCPPIVLSVITDKIAKKKIAQNKAAMHQYIKENTIPELFVLPEDYRYYIAVEYIYSCFIEHRADTLKEALNLYVEQRDRWINQNMTQQIMAIQRQQNTYLRFIAVTNVLK